MVILCGERKKNFLERVIAGNIKSKDDKDYFKTNKYEIELINKMLDERFEKSLSKGKKKKAIQ